MPKLKKSAEDRQRDYKVVMWDGEGCNLEGKQDYVLLCNSEGLVLKNADLSHLSTKTIFDALLANQGDEDTLHVGFGMSYDVTMWLRQLSFEKHVFHANGTLGTPGDFIRSIFHSKKVKKASIPFIIDGNIYKVEYQSRKKFTLSRLEMKTTKHKNGKVSKRLKPVESITIWDIQGAYIGGFADVIESFGIIDDKVMIREMKAARKTFTRDEIEKIQTYCLTECKWGSILYRTTLDFACDTNLILKRHDGGGAFASAMLNLEGVTNHLPPRDKSSHTQEELLSVRRAFFGGRIENAIIGVFNNLFEIDKNSAYPAEMMTLPSMIGKWTEHEGAPIEGDPDCLYIVKVRWDFDLGLHFYPLLYRTPTQEVLAPNSGAGEYWFPDYRACLVWCERFGQDLPEVMGYRKFTPDDRTVKPMAFIQRYYDLRMKDKERIGKVIKIGMNSGYGKTAQQLGGTRASTTEDLSLPPFFSQEWAGMITSGTRAALVEAACKLEDPRNLVGFATDAILTLEDPGISIPGKKLGDWEVPTVFETAVVIQAGVRYTSTTDLENYPSGWVGKTRGFPVKACPTPEPILEAWAKKEDHITVEVDRFYTFSSAILGDDMWEKRGQWERVTRDIDITGQCPKRNQNTEIYGEGGSEVSLRAAGATPSLLSRYVALEVPENLFYEVHARRGITIFSEPYESLEAIESKHAKRVNHTFVEE